MSNLHDDIDFSEDSMSSLLSLIIGEEMDNVASADLIEGTDELKENDTTANSLGGFDEPKENDTTIDSVGVCDEPKENDGTAYSLAGIAEPKENIETADSLGFGGSDGPRENYRPADSLEDTDEPKDNDGPADSLGDTDEPKDNDGPADSLGNTDEQKGSEGPIIVQPEAVEPSSSKKKRKPRKRKKKGKGMESGNVSEAESMEQVRESSKSARGISAPVSVVSYETYVIEGIVRRRTHKSGHYEYLVRWKNYTKDDDTWEPRDRLLADGLTRIIPYYDKLWDAGKRIYLSDAEFERRTRKVKMEKIKEQLKEQGSTDAENSNCVAQAKVHVKKPKRLSDGILIAVPKGRQLDRILGVTMHNSILVYLVKWVHESDDENTVYQIRDLHENNCNVIRASVVDNAFPDQVIKFYEENSQPLDIPNESHKDRVRAAEDAMEMAKRRRIEAIAYENRMKRYEERLARGDCLDKDDDDADDEASLAIAQEAKAKEKKFDPNTDSSSEEDEDEMDPLIDQDVLKKLERGTL